MKFLPLTPKITLRKYGYKLKAAHIFDDVTCGGALKDIRWCGLKTLPDIAPSFLKRRGYVRCPLDAPEGPDDARVIVLYKDGKPVITIVQLLLDGLLPDED